MKIEIERTPGFLNADGSEKITYQSANQAFNAYLNATGQKKTSRTKAQFKDWMQKLKDSGKMNQLIQGGKQKITELVEQKKEEIKEIMNQPARQADPLPDKKPMKIMGMPPGLAIGVMVLAAGIIIGGIYVLTRPKKATA